MSRRSCVSVAALANKTAPSSVEVAKGASRHLRGSLTESLDDGETGFADSDVQVLKFHGMYQQEALEPASRRRSAIETQ